MDASSIKKWNATSGDFNHSDDVDYEKNFRYARLESKQVEKKITVFAGLMALGAIICLLEYLSRF